MSEWLRHTNKGRAFYRRKGDDRSCTLSAPGGVSVTEKPEVKLHAACQAESWFETRWMRLITAEHEALEQDKYKGKKDELSPPDVKQGTVRGGRSRSPHRGTANEADIKVYATFPQVPNPLFVDIFAREKGIDLTPLEKIVNLPELENRKGDNQKNNPAGQLPYLELKDGTIIAETMAICEYLEEVKPSPALIGASPQERGVARMWQRRMEEHFVYPCFNGCRFASAHPDYPEKTGGAAPFKNFFKERATAENGANLIPEAHQGMRDWSTNKLKWLENVKKDSADEFICGKRFTAVDIQVWTTIRFFGAADEPCLKEMRKLSWMSAWYDRVAERPHVKAAMEHSKGMLW